MKDTDWLLIKKLKFSKRGKLIHSLYATYMQHIFLVEAGTSHIMKEWKECKEWLQISCYVSSTNYLDLSSGKNWVRGDFGKIWCYKKFFFWS